MMVGMAIVMRTATMTITMVMPTMMTMTSNDVAEHKRGGKQAQKHVVAARYLSAKTIWQKVGAGTLLVRCVFAITHQRKMAPIGMPRPGPPCY